MKHLTLLAAIIMVAACSNSPKVDNPDVEVFKAKGGSVQISCINHGSIAVSYKDYLIQIDPVKSYGGKELDYESFPKADLILITHEHGDHYNKETIELLSKDDTRIITNGKVHDMLGYGESMSNGQSTEAGKGIKIDATPAYNTTEGRTQFHPKGNGNGYVLFFDGLRVYIAGDTENIPEMAELQDIDVAFLPVNQPYTMTVDQCVAAARTIAPKVLIPYHFSQTDLSSLPSRLPEIKVLLRDMQ